MIKNKYRCEKCNESFESLRTYINHLELHKESLVELPEKPKPFLTKIFSFFNKKKQVKQNEVKQMTNETKVEQKPEEVIQQGQNEQMNARIEAIERSIAQLSSLIVSQKEAEAEAESEPEQEIPETTPEPIGKGKLMRITVQVKEKDMPNLLKEVQEKDEYTMENIEVIDKQ